MMESWVDQRSKRGAAPRVALSRWLVKSCKAAEIQSDVQFVERIGAVADKKPHLKASSASSLLIAAGSSMPVHREVVTQSNKSLSHVTLAASRHRRKNV